MTEGKATPIKVFIVLISNKGLHATTKVGACYWNEHAAEIEATRIREANSHSLATVIDRELDWPCFLTQTKPGHPPGWGQV